MASRGHDPSGKQKHPAPIPLGKNVRRGKSSAGVLRKRVLNHGTDHAGSPPETPNEENS